MALTRRQMLVALPMALGAVACAARQPGRGTPDEGLRVLGENGKAGAPLVLVMMPDTRQTREAWTGMSDELKSECHLVAVRSDTDNAVATISTAIAQFRPKAIVLMNNPTVAAYREYRRLNARAARLPAVVTMTSLLSTEELAAIDATGVAYEVPLITVVTNLRKLMATPIDRVAVVHRAPFAGFVQHQIALAEREQIVLSRFEVSATPNPSELKAALRDAKLHSDALWILNDDRLLSQFLIAEGWLPALNERPWRPTIVGAASLVSAVQSFGTFAVLPDHTALGEQTASLVMDLESSDWELPQSCEAQEPLSTTTTVDLTQAEERFSLRKDALAQIDRIVQE